MILVAFKVVNVFQQVFLFQINIFKMTEGDSTVPDTEDKDGIAKQSDSIDGEDSGEGSSGACAAKTPVSLLQELYVRRGLGEVRHPSMTWCR